GGIGHRDAFDDAQVRDGDGRDLGVEDGGQRLPHAEFQSLILSRVSHQFAPGCSRYSLVISSHRGSKSSEWRPCRPPAPANPPSWTHRLSRRTIPGTSRVSPSASISPDDVGTISPPTGPWCSST